MKRSVFFISDRTGITVEGLGRSLLTQFPDFSFNYRKFPFVDTEQQIQVIAEEVQQAGIQEGQPALVFCSLVDDAMRDTLVQTGAPTAWVMRQPIRGAWTP